MQPGTGNLPGGPEAAHPRAAPGVGGDTATGVVGGGHYRDLLAGRVHTVLQAPSEDRGEALPQPSAGAVGYVQVGAW